MEVINQPSEWFLKDSSAEKFNSYESLAEKTVFMYSYLKTVSNDSFEKSNTLFKMAFLISDAIRISNAAFKDFKNLADPEQNPFIMYLKNSKKCFGEQEIFLSLMAILQNKVDVNDKSAWIYDEDFFEDYYSDKLDEMGCWCRPDIMCVIDKTDPAKFDVEESLQMAALEIYWLFGMSIDEDEEDYDE